VSELKPMPYGPLIELDQHISPEVDAAALANVRYWADRDAADKHLTDAECAAEYWRAKCEWVTAQELAEVVVWHRFAENPHAHEADQ
jgi:hypothetical protein